MQSKRIFLFSVLSLCLILSIASVSAFSFSNWFGKITGKVVSEDQSVLGVTDGVSNGAVGGWARDPDYQAAGQYIEVQFYIDNEYAGSTNANVASEPAIGGNGNHRFSWTIPDKYYDGQNHEVWAYGIGKLSDGSSSNSNTQLGSPSYSSRVFTFQQKFTCSLFTYSAWSDCTNGQQTRTVVASEPSGCTGGSPITTQSCTTPSSNPDSTNPLNVKLQISSNGTFSDSPGSVSVHINLGEPIYISSSVSGTESALYAIEYINYSDLLAGKTSWSQLTSWSPVVSSEYVLVDYYFPSAGDYYIRASAKSSSGDYYSNKILVYVKTKTTSSCVDSDNGLNTYTFGKVIDKTGKVFTDYCSDNQIIIEHVCSTSPATFDLGSANPTNCPYGCLDGACQNKTSFPICSSILERVSYPSNFKMYGIEYNVQSYGGASSSYMWIGEKMYNTTNYYASWYTNYDSDADEIAERYSLSYNIMVFEDKEVDLSQLIKDENIYSFCSTESFWSENNKENTILVCNYYNPLYSNQYYDSNNQEILWIKDNILVRAGIHSGEPLSEEEQSKLASISAQKLLEGLKNNQFEPVDRSKFSVQYPVSSVIAQDLISCSSEVELKREGTNYSCQPYWECKLEPAICPPHGFQTRICQDRSCDQKREEKVSCSPGACSGCMIPRWFGEKYSDNTCMPYGSRFAAESGFSMKLVEGSDVYTISDSKKNRETSITVISSTQAILTLIEDEKSFSYNLTLGEKIDITQGLSAIDEGLVSLSVSPTRIYYNSNEERNYVDLDIDYLINKQVVDTFNAYCDYDGNVKAQKDRDVNGDWAKCQNNHECLSNFCSSGECIEVQDLIEQGSGIKRVVSSILCRISSALTSETYDECIASLE